MIRVCDAIMGTGKSQSAIAYMNEHSDNKFIYVTPYLDEATRIRKICLEMNFIEPRDDLYAYGFSKSKHTMALIAQGMNVTTTHQAFLYYTDDTLQLIKEREYTLIIDENINMLEKSKYIQGDVDVLEAGGYIKEIDGVYEVIRDDYEGSVFQELFRILKSRSLIRTGNDASDAVLYWSMPVELLLAFKDVFILTYLFAGQSIKYLLDINKCEYEYIGVERTEDGGFRFTDGPGYIPEYVHRLPEMITILDNPRMNAVGDRHHDLSMSWYERSKANVDELKRHVYNYFNNVCGNIPPHKKMCATYSSYESALKGKGYSRSFVSFNTKATNAYRDRTHLAYCVNLFMNVSEKLHYVKCGIEVNEDMYALSIMIQWIWRSAIRDGKPITVYIPSKRMRTLLQDWIEEVSH